MAHVGRATFFVASRSPNDRERLSRISEILKRAADEIEKIGQEGPQTGDKAAAEGQQL
jgi:hypothetical protein